MSKWVIGGTTMGLNPSDDSGWVTEHVFSEHHAPGATFTIVQSVGLKSAYRQISGWVQSSADRTALQSALTTSSVGTAVSITDHHGVANTVLFLSVEWEEKRDIANLITGTYTYKAKMLKVT